MRSSQRIVRRSLILSLMFLVACGGQGPISTPIDPAVIFTSAAQTVAAQLTETAGVFTPSPQATATATPAPPTATFPFIGFNTPVLLGTPEIVNTPSGMFTGLPTPTLFILSTQSGLLFDDSVFMGDITIDDGTQLQTGQEFKKIWRTMNTGVNTWDEGYTLAFASGDPLGGAPFVIRLKKDFVESGKVVDLGINMSAPDKPGEYGGCWRMKNDKGVYFGTFFCVAIKVVK